MVDYLVLSLEEVPGVWEHCVLDMLKVGGLISWAKKEIRSLTGYDFPETRSPYPGHAGDDHIKLMHKNQDLAEGPENLLLEFLVQGGVRVALVTPEVPVER